MQCVRVEKENVCKKTINDDKLSFIFVHLYVWLCVGVCGCACICGYMCLLWFIVTMTMQIYICLRGTQLICSLVCSWKNDLFVIFSDSVLTVTGTFMYAYAYLLTLRTIKMNVNCTCKHTYLLIHTHIFMS